MICMCGPFPAASPACQFMLYASTGRLIGLICFNKFAPCWQTGLIYTTPPFSLRLHRVAMQAENTTTPENQQTQNFTNVRLSVTDNIHAP